MRKLKKILKWVGIVLAALVLLIAIGVGVASCMYASHRDATFETAGHDFEIPDDPALAGEGERLYLSRGCGECHGPDGAGRVLLDIPPFLMAPPNITGVMRALEPADLHRLIRRGVRGDGTPIFFMPSHEYQRMPDEELGLIVMHVRSLPQSDAVQPPSEMRILGRVLWALDVFDTPMFPAEVIDQDAPFEPIGEGELGEYIGASCTGCHGQRLSGGPIPGAPEEATGIPSNLTPHQTGLAGWSIEDFRTLLRTGIRPDGTEVNPDFMPWRVYRHENDEEIEALWDFLQSREPLPFGSR